MASRAIHQTKFGACAVTIYRDTEWGEYIVKAKVAGKVEGGNRLGGYHTDHKGDARSTAAHMVRELKKRPACKDRSLAGARTTSKAKKQKKRAKSKKTRKQPY